MSVQALPEREAMPSGEMFDRWAEVYDSQENPFFSLEQMVLKEVVPDLHGLDVLDAGCGTGRLFEFLQQHGATRLVGVDSSAAMVRHAEARGIAKVMRGSCDALPLPESEFDLAIASFVLSYVPNLKMVAAEMMRVCRPGAKVIISDMHPDTAHKLGWRRTFRYENEAISLPWFQRSLIEIITAFESAGWCFEICEERAFTQRERPAFARAGKSEYLKEIEKYPALFVLRFRKRNKQEIGINFSEGRCVASARDAFPRDLAVEGKKIWPVDVNRQADYAVSLEKMLIFPGLINAHDHLEFALYPRMGRGPYQNATDWANDIHEVYAEEIERQKSVPREARVLWGALRNLLCGVTTVCHHNPLLPEMLAEDFPVEVVREMRWAHSLAVEADVCERAAQGDPQSPFIIHAAEGVDEKASLELEQLRLIGVVGSQTVLVHGLAMSTDQTRDLNKSGGAVILCPSSNQFLFEQVPAKKLIASLERAALGSDSPLTAEGDLLDEVRFASKKIGVDAESLYSMVTIGSAKILGLKNREGCIAEGAVADFIAVADPGGPPAEVLCGLSWRDVELVVRRGRVFLASGEMMQRLPEALCEGLERLWVDGEERWVRAPLAKMFEQVNCLSQSGVLSLGGREVRYGGA